jgi:tRNA threonylcarbamoyladenosine biosynthesis protein TsaB
MKNLIIDAASKKIFLTLMVNKNIYTQTYDNSKNNFDKLVILINKILIENKVKIGEIDGIYINRGPGSFAGIRTCLSIVKGFFLVYKIDYYCFSFDDFSEIDIFKYEDVPYLCDKFRVKKNLINPLYLS